MRRPPPDLEEKLLAVSNRFSATALDISVDDVARMAGVPRATLYYYFAGKDDLLAFYMNAELTHMGDAVAKAAAGEGRVQDRLDAALTAILSALAQNLVMCIELPTAVKQAGDFQEVLAAIDRVVLAPIRELLIEGVAAGKLDVADVRVTAIALMGAIHMVGMMQYSASGSIDVEKIGAALIPQLITGLVKHV